MCEGCSDLIPRYLTWLSRGDATHRPKAQRTIGERETILRRIDRELPDGLGHASADEIAAWRQPFTGWTAVTYDSALRSCLGWAAREGRVDFDPMQYLGHPVPGPRVPHPCTDEELAIALTAPRYWRRAVLLGAYAGTRCTEMCTVTTYDMIGNRLRIYGKGRKFRTVPIHPDLAEELHGTPPGPLLVGDHGRALSGRSLTMMQRQVWRDLGLRDGFTLHSLRHWCITQWFIAGATAPEVAQMAGWSSLEMAQNYAKVFDERTAAAVSRVPGIPHARQAGPGRSRPRLPQVA